MLHWALLDLPRILPGLGNHHRKSYWLQRNFKHSYTLTVKSKPTTLLHLVSSKPTIQHPLAFDEKVSQIVQVQSTNFSSLSNNSLVTIFKQKMAFVLAHPGMKLNCISSISTCHFINFSITFSISSGPYLLTLFPYSFLFLIFLFIPL